MDSLHDQTSARTFDGSLSFTEGEETDVGIVLLPAELRLSTGGSEIGRWMRSNVAVSRKSDDTFQMLVDGEVVWFQPRSAEEFGAAIESWLAAEHGVGAPPPSPDRPDAESPDAIEETTLEWLFENVYEDGPDAPPVRQQDDASSLALDGGEDTVSADADGYRSILPAAPDDEGELFLPGSSRPIPPSSGPDNSVSWSAAPPTPSAEDAPVEGEPFEPETQSDASSADDITAPDEDLEAIDVPFDPDDASGEEPADEGSDSDGSEHARSPHPQSGVPQSRDAESGDPDPADAGPAIDLTVLDLDLVSADPPVTDAEGVEYLEQGIEVVAAIDDEIDAPPSSWQSYEASEAIEELLDADTDPGEHAAFVFEPEEDTAGPGRFAGTARSRFARMLTERKSSSSAGTDADVVSSEGPIDSNPDPIEDATVADRVRNVQNTMRATAKKSFASKKVVRASLLSVVVLATVGGLGVGILSLIGEPSNGSPGENDTPSATVALGVDGDDAPQPSTAGDADSAATVPTDPPPPTTAADQAELLSIAEMTTGEFIDAWDEVATKVSPILGIPISLAPGDFAFGFTPHVSMRGVVSAADSIGEFAIVVDPNGDPSSDALALQTLGVAIGVADPSTSGPDRRAILADLGLDVAAPRLDGIDGRLRSNGVDYRLIYDLEAERLVFTIRPS